MANGVCRSDTLLYRSKAAAWRVRARPNQLGTTRPRHVRFQATRPRCSCAPRSGDIFGLTSAVGWTWPFPKNQSHGRCGSGLTVRRPMCRSSRAAHEPAAAAAAKEPPGSDLLEVRYTASRSLVHAVSSSIAIEPRVLTNSGPRRMPMFVFSYARLQ